MVGNPVDAAMLAGESGYVEGSAVFGELDPGDEVRDMTKCVIC
ncbi:hypothetical protein BQ8482_440015 [Mesorhizobium delmotii]|uniref:Uncharacterized protein n=1 Tax=Mesorhizobium delmotii TaxID=1631247 RepID=A0A2P9ATF9_9HYPH|nr:hypothetical protein BQ8482_440015 [Mesorhizobium delmotii]